MMQEKLKGALEDLTGATTALHQAVNHAGPDEKTERPLEVVFRPTHRLAMVYLRNPTRPEPEIEYLRQALPDVDIRVDPKVDYVLLKLDASTFRQMTEFAAKNRTWR